MIDISIENTGESFYTYADPEVPKLIERLEREREAAYESAFGGYEGCRDPYGQMYKELLKGYLKYSDQITGKILWLQLTFGTLHMKLIKVPHADNNVSI